MIAYKVKKVKITDFSNLIIYEYFLINIQIVWQIIPNNF